MDKLLKQLGVLMNSPTLTDNRTGRRYIVTGFHEDGAAHLTCIDPPKHTKGAAKALEGDGSMRLKRLDGFTITPRA